MSVLIKGMKMPKRGLVEVIISPKGICYELERPLIDTEHAEVSGYFDAVEMPDHGDLIDRDALMTRLGMAMECEDCPNCTMLHFCGLPTEVMEVCDELENAPVVIPTERSEE